MTEKTLMSPKFLLKNCYSEVIRKEDLLCSNSDNRERMNSCINREHALEGENRLPTIRSEYLQGAYCTSRVMASVKVSSSDRQPIRGVKRRSPFGLETRQASCKWIRRDTHPSSPDDVISTTSDPDDSHIEQGASSGIPSPVDEDDKSNDSIDDGISFQNNGSHLYQYGGFPVMVDSPYFGHVATTGERTYTLNDVIESCLLSDSSTEIDSHENIFSIEEEDPVQHDNRNHTSGVCISECSSNDEMTRSCHEEMDTSSFHQGVATPTEDICYNFVRTPSDERVSRRTLSNNNDLALNKQAMKMVSKEWKRVLKSINGFVMVLSPDLTTLFVSPNVVDYLGFTQNQMLGRSVKDFIHPSHHSLIQDAASTYPPASGERLYWCQHSLSVRMTIRFPRNKQNTDTTYGYKVVRWFTIRPVSMPGTDNGDRVGNTICICLPCKSQSLSIERPLRENIDLLNSGTRVVLGYMIRNMTPSYYSYESMDALSILPQLMSMLRSGCTMCQCSKGKQVKAHGNHCGSNEVITMTHKHNNGRHCDSCVYRENGTEEHRAEQTYLKHPKYLSSMNFPPYSFHSTSSQKQLDQLKNSSLIHHSYQELWRILLDKMYSHCQKTTPTHKHDHFSHFGFSKRCERKVTEKQNILVSDLCHTKRNKKNVPTQDIQNTQETVNYNEQCTKSTLYINSMTQHLQPESSTTLPNVLESSQCDHSSVPLLTQYSEKEHIDGPSLTMSKSFPTKPVHKPGICRKRMNEYHDVIQTQGEESIAKHRHLMFTETSEAEKIEGILKPHDQNDQICEGNIQSLCCDASSSCQAITNVSPSLMGYPLHNTSHDIDLEQLVELDFSSEFSFKADDVVMPVESGLECMNDLVLDSSSNAIDFNSVNDQICTEGISDSFSTQYSDDYSYSFVHEINREEYQPFDHLLNFTTSEFTSTSGNVLNSFPLGLSSSTESTQASQGSNELLMEMDVIVPQNKNPFVETSSLDQSLIHQSCFSSDMEPLIKPSQEEENNRPSLLRTLLNVGDVPETSISAEQKQQHSRQHYSEFPKQDRPNVFHKSVNTFRSKELPVPKVNASKAVQDAFCSSKTSKELPLPCSLMKTASANKTSPQIPVESSYGNRHVDSCDAENSQTIFDSKYTDENYKELDKFVNDLDNSSSLNDDNANDGEDDLPEDLVDLAMEYCGSLDNKETDNVISELKEQINWGKDLLNPTSMPKDSFNGVDLYTSLSQKKCNNADNTQLRSNSSVCLPLSNNSKLKNNFDRPLSSEHPNSQSTTSNSNRHYGGSLLRQAVTSPNVDKLIEQIPLARQFSEKCKSSTSSSSIFSHFIEKNLHSNLERDQKDCQSSVHFHFAGRNCDQSAEKVCDKSFVEKRKGAKCLSKLASHVIPVKTDVVSAVSHISISVPPRHPKKSLSSKSNISPITVKISASNDNNNNKQKSLSKASFTHSSNNTKISNSVNSSSEPVSVLIMRKENHRSRRSKTVAIQTDNQPDEIYPALERSPSDVILSPSIYLETCYSPPLTKTSPVKPKSPSHNCNIFSSSIRSLASSRDCRELPVTSPCPSHTSSSSLSELEQHLRGFNSPESNVSPPSSCESEVSSEVPFLQRLLTGELSKDRYEKLDKDSLKRQRSGSSSSLSDSQV